MKYKVKNYKNEIFVPYEFEKIIEYVAPFTFIKPEGQEKRYRAREIEEFSKAFIEQYKYRKKVFWLPKGRMWRSDNFGYSLLFHFLFYVNSSLRNSFLDYGEFNAVIVIIVITSIFTLLLLYFKLILIVIRLHDISLSGGWCIIVFPLFPLFDLISLFIDGIAGKNKYGKDLKNRAKKV